MQYFWQKFLFFSFHPNENKISKTLIKLHEHESDQIYRSIIRSAFNTHTSRQDWCGEKENWNKRLQCAFQPKPGDFCVSMSLFFITSNLIFQLFETIIFFLYQSDLHRHIWVYVVQTINICLMYHILPRACFMKSKKKYFVQRRTRLMTFENFKSDWIDLRTL